MEIVISRTDKYASHERRGPAGERLARGEPREAVVHELAVGLAAGDGRGADRDLRRDPDPRGQLLVGVGEPLELVRLCANQPVSQVHCHAVEQANFASCTAADDERPGVAP